LQPPLCAVRAGQKKNQVFYIGEEKRNRKKKAKRGFAPASPSMRRPRRTKDNIGILYWIRKKKQARKEARRASPCSKFTVFTT